MMHRTIYIASFCLLCVASSVPVELSLQKPLLDMATSALGFNDCLDILCWRDDTGEHVLSISLSFSLVKLSRNPNYDTRVMIGSPADSVPKYTSSVIKTSDAQLSASVDCDSLEFSPRPVYLETASDYLMQPCVLGLMMEALVGILAISASAIVVSLILTCFALVNVRPPTTTKLYQGYKSKATSLPTIVRQKNDQHLNQVKLPSSNTSIHSVEECISVVDRRIRVEMTSSSGTQWNQTEDNLHPELLQTTDIEHMEATPTQKPPLPNVGNDRSNFPLVSSGQCSLFHMEIMEDILLPRKSVTVGAEIGKGAFGKVLAGSVCKMSDGKEVCLPVAIKTLKSDAGHLNISDLVEEALIMKNFNHPNVVALRGVCMEFDHKEPPLLCLEFMPRGNLHSFLRRSCGVDEWPKLGRNDHPTELSANQLINFCIEIAEGMAYLSGCGFVHRDLASRNCLLTENLVVKVGDFGLARDIREDNYYRMATARRLPVKWMALESLVDQIFTIQSDIWSYGVVMWEIFTLGQIPYPGVANHEMLDHLLSGHRLTLPDSCMAQDIYPIMASCWSFQPSERPSFNDIVVRLKEYLDNFYVNIAVRTCKCTIYQNINPKMSVVRQRDTTDGHSYTCSHANNESSSKGGVLFDELILSFNPSYPRVILPVTREGDKSAFSAPSVTKESDGRYELSPVLQASENGRREVVSDQSTSYLKMPCCQRPGDHRELVYVNVPVRSGRAFQNVPSQVSLLHQGNQLSCAVSGGSPPSATVSVVRGVSMPPLDASVDHNRKRHHRKEGRLRSWRSALASFFSSR